MHGVKRVIIFCAMITILPTILIIMPLYLRHVVFVDVIYSVAESDILAVTDGISTIFCESQSLRMNTTFNAFQLKQTPEMSNKRKHIRLKKSMVLPDDTLEYWGFYLLKGASVMLRVCSRYEGSRILVVRGEKNLRTCGLMEHNFKKFGAKMDHDHTQVKVTFGTVAQEIPIVEQNEIEKTEVPVINQTEDVSQFIKTKLKKSGSKVKEVQKKVQLGKNGSRKGNHSRRHVRKKLRKELQQKLNEDENRRLTRQILDGGIEHGGNAPNHTRYGSGESSVSSFETDLLRCYNGQILLTQGFSPSHLCNDVDYLESSRHMQTVHTVTTDGYYYYIFYSDNDFVRNDIHAIFDIYKPTLQYSNISESKARINTTECRFEIKTFSDEIVVVEVPTRDGIEHEGDDITLLISTCHPRMSVYIVFPISVMVFILICAFM